MEPDEVKDLSVVESLLSKFSHVEVKVGIGRGEDELGPEMPTQEVIALINGVLRVMAGRRPIFLLFSASPLWILSKPGIVLVRGKMVILGYRIAHS